MKIQLRSAILSICVVPWSFIFCDSHLHAKPLPQANRPYEYTSHGQSLTDILQYFGKNIGVPVKIAGQLNTPVQLPKDMRWTRQSFLNYLSAQHQLVWYLDESALYFSSTEDQMTELYAFKQPNTGDVLSALSRIGLLETKFVHRYDPISKMLLVKGPPDYVDRIKKALVSFEKANRLTPTILRGHVELNGPTPFLPTQATDDKGLLPSL